MNSIPAGGSDPVMYSEFRVWHVTPNSQPLQGIDNGSSAGLIAERNSVDISEAARGSSEKHGHVRQQAMIAVGSPHGTHKGKQ